MAWVVTYDHHTFRDERHRVWTPPMDTPRDAGIVRRMLDKRLGHAYDFEIMHTDELNVRWAPGLSGRIDDGFWLDKPKDKG